MLCKRLEIKVEAAAAAGFFLTCERYLANSLRELEMMTSSSVSEVPRMSNWNWSRLSARTRLARESDLEASITSPMSREMPFIRDEVWR